jgi:hypothetical protein
MAHQIPSELSGLSQCTAATLPPPAFQGRQVLGRALTRMFSGGFEARGRRTSRKKRPDMFCYMTIYHKSPWKITSSINCTRISRQKYIHKRTMFIHFELSWIALLEHVKVSPDSDPPQHIKKRLLHITKRLLRCPSGTPKSTGWLTEWGSSRATFHLYLYN